VVVVGASSGGLDPLIQLVGGLPADLPAAVFVVVHVRPDVPSHLPAILNRAGCMPAAHAVDGEPIRRGRIYVAPPGFHTYVDRGHIRVARGPQENSSRPAIDPLFRTAAHHYGTRVVGVVLSGALDDGSAGLQAIKNSGGCAIVQDPCDAEFPDMPANACERTDVDYSLPAHELAARVVDIVTGDGTSDILPVEVPLETAEEAPTGERALRSEDLGPPSGFTCPDCHGAFWEIADGETVRYRCRVEHASEDAMVKAQTDSVERALWAALRSLEERAALIQRLADNARRRGHAGVAALFDARSRRMDADIKVIHDVIANGQVLEPVGHDGIRAVIAADK
jgi:two-component system chemotaxis response regulator CheB